MAFDQASNFHRAIRIIKKYGKSWGKHSASHQRAMNQVALGAQFNSGYVYNHCQGAPEDLKKALRWYRNAVK